MAQLALIDAYQAFMTTAQPFARITSEEGSYCVRIVVPVTD